MKAHLATVAAAAAIAGALTGYLLAPSPGDASAKGTAATAAVPRAAGAAAGSADARGAPKSLRTRHVALNMPAGDRAKAAALGYNLFDVDPDEGEIASLPEGSQALLWVGNTTCGGFELAGDAFTQTVKRLAGNPRVYGWYLSDEPNPKECPDIVAKIRQRADVIHRYAPGQKAFASLTDWPMTPLAPSATHLDLIGLDPYPCRADSGGGCDLKAIDTMVGQATRAGFPKRMIVPVFQTFGQSCSSGEKNWRLPAAAQLQAILNRWDRLVPSPAFDISYSWGRQDEWACPTLKDADGTAGQPDLQAVMKRHNARHTVPSPASTPPSSTPSGTPSAPAQPPSDKRCPTAGTPG